MVSDATTLGPASNGYVKPADNECILWEDKNFNGSTQSLQLDTSKCTGGPYILEAGHEVNIWRLDHFNDKMSSWACGKDVAFDFCNDSFGDSCRSHHGNTGVGPSKSNAVGYEDKATTVRFYCNDHDREAAMIFSDDSCTDVVARITPTDDPK